MEETHSLDERPQSFFKMIAGSDSSENILSRFFCACFSNSPAFAQVALTTIWQGAGLSGSAPKPDGWACHYQCATPEHGGGRPDLCLIPPSKVTPGLTASHKPIFIESKVQSVLGEKQLKRYKEYGTEVLVAITKNWPEVSQQKLDSIGVKSLRWQDMCRALRQIKIRGPKNQFLCEKFATYLEESRMAYREDITPKELEKVRSLLVKVASQKNEGHNVPRAAFQTANDLMEFFQDARRLVQERLPTFAWAKWGPAYHHEFDDNDDEIAEHALGFGFWKGKRALNCYIYFPVEKSELIHFWLWLTRQNKEPLEKLLPVKNVLSKRKLDADKLADAVVKAARAWHVV